MYLGSWKIDDLVTFTCNTHRVDTGEATDADSVPTYRVYEDETGTAILTGSMALLDSSNTAGFYSEQITLSAANGFEKGKSYNIYISATVNGVTGTSSRFLQVEAEVDANRINWANVDGATTTVNLSGTTVKNATDVLSDTANIKTRLPAALSGDGFIKADVKSIDDELTSGNNATLNLKKLNIVNSDIGEYGLYLEGNSAAALIYSPTTALDIESDNSHAVFIKTFSPGSHDAINVSIGTGTGKSINALNDIAVSDGDLTLANITDSIWDEATSGHTTAGTTGKALTDAGSAGDPWGTALPGSYTTGTAGKIIGDNIDATISSRSSHSAADVWTSVTRTLTTISDSAGVTTLLSRIASVLNISSGKVESNVKQVNDTNLTGDGSSGNPWGPA